MWIWIIVIAIIIGAILGASSSKDGESAYSSGYPFSISGDIRSLPS